MCTYEKGVDDEKINSGITDIGFGGSGCGRGK
jgi:hypothetical protein